MADHNPVKTGEVFVSCSALCEHPARYLRLEGGRVGLICTVSARVVTELLLHTHQDFRHDTYTGP